MEQKGTLKYRKVQRTPQTGENAGKKKWYATSVTDREVDFEGFVSHISDHGSPYSRGTIHGVLINAELRKKCKIQEYGGYIGTDEEGTTGGGTTGGGTEQGGGSDTSQGGGTTGGGTTGDGTQGGGSQDKGDGLE